MAELMLLRLKLLLSALSSVVAQSDDSHTLFHLRLIPRLVLFSLLRHNPLPPTVVPSILLRCDKPELSRFRVERFHQLFEAVSLQRMLLGGGYLQEHHALILVQPDGVNVPLVLLLWLTEGSPRRRLLRMVHATH